MSVNIESITNKVDCSLESVYGTGSKGCKSFLKNVSAIWLLKKGTEIDSTTVLNENAINTLQIDSKLVILKGVTNFTDESEDNVLETLEDGTKTLVRKGKYEFSAEFISGLYFHKALNSLSSFSRYDVIFVDSENNILGKVGKDAGLSGFSAGMVQSKRYMFATSSTASKQGITVQLLDPNELDKDHAFISNTSLPKSFKPNSIDGINDVSIEFVAQPADAGNYMFVDVVFEQGKGAVVGLESSDFRIRTGQTEFTISTLTETTDGRYEIEIAETFTTSTFVDISLYDSVRQATAIIKEGCILSSSPITTTVM